MNTLSVIVRDRTGVLYQGEAKTVSGKNEKGPFDVLPEHANFLTLISDEVVIRLSGDTKSFKLTRGMLSVVDDQVTILLGVIPNK